MEDLLTNSVALGMSYWNAGRYLFGITIYEWGLGILSQINPRRN